MLVRTDADNKHGGLSVLLIPNDTPGLVINKLPTLSRHATGTTEIFLDEVRVPRDALLGDGVCQGGLDVLLVDHVVKGLRPVFARDDLVHGRAVMPGPG